MILIYKKECCRFIVFYTYPLGGLELKLIAVYRVINRLDFDLNLYQLVCKVMDIFLETCMKKEKYTITNHLIITFVTLLRSSNEIENVCYAIANPFMCILKVVCSGNMTWAYIVA